MSRAELVPYSPWSHYSKKLVAKIETPNCVGFFSDESAKERRMRLVIGEEGAVEEGSAVRLYWFVDPNDGVIVDAKFQVFGHSALIGATEAACELTVGRNYDQVNRVTAELVDRHLRDKVDTPAFPKESWGHLTFVLTAVERAVEKCRDIPFATNYVSPIPGAVGEKLPGGYPGFDEMSLEKKLAVIEQVLDAEVRPFIALDAGGIEVLNLINNRELMISYKGSCTSCPSSAGATLAHIQQVVQARVHPEIQVVPDFFADSPG